VCVRQHWPPPPPATSSSLRQRLDLATPIHGWDVARATQISVGVARGHGSTSVLGVVGAEVGAAVGGGGTSVRVAGGERVEGIRCEG
jgi:hypothetical protein